MWDKLSPYIDSGKKLKIKGDKLISLLIKNKFSGTLSLCHNQGTDTISFIEDSVYSSKEPEYIAFVLFNSMFLLSSKKDINGEKDNASKFLYRVVSAFPEQIVRSMLDSHISDFFSIKPDTAKMTFLSEHMKKFVGKKKIPLVSVIEHESKTAYFLLLTENAAIIKPTEEEAKAIKEEVDKMPGHRPSEIKTEDKPAPQPILDKPVVEKPAAEKPDEFKPESFDRYLSKLEKQKSIFEMFGVDENTAPEELHKNYIKIVQRLHPDRLSGESEQNRSKATELITVINNAYSILKDEEKRKRLVDLQKKYGNIRTKDQFEHFDEVHNSFIKAEALLKFREFMVAYKIFLELYNLTGLPQVLEKVIIAYHAGRRSETQDKDDRPASKREVKDEQLERLIGYYEKLKELKPNVPTEILYITVEAYESAGNTQKAIDMLKEIQRRDPTDRMASGWMKKLKMYEKK